MKNLSDAQLLLLDLLRDGPRWVTPSYSPKLVLERRLMIKPHGSSYWTLTEKGKQALIFYDDRIKKIKP